MNNNLLMTSIGWSINMLNFSLFNAAKSLEQIILVCKELGHLNEIGELAQRACIMYQQHGSPDSGALCLEKAAKMIETQYPDQAVELYRHGVDVVLVCMRFKIFLHCDSKIIIKLYIYIYSRKIGQGKLRNSVVNFHDC
jgi:hypothetical protein